MQYPRFFLDTEGKYYPEASSFLLTGKYLKLLIGILHSVAFTFFFKNFYSGGQLGKSGYRYKKVFLEKTPIPLPNNKNHELIQRIEDIVNTILTNRQKSKDTSTEETEINKLVYQLYGLTDEEVDFIEKINSKRMFPVSNTSLA